MVAPFGMLVFDVEAPLPCRDLFWYLRSNNCRRRLRRLRLNLERQRLDHSDSGA